ncbi:hypothetical protein Q2T41_18825 [Maribacter confluentis]|uniref:Uncharacterized protein n=1 Tax=Maribacter confluentis TaxID=1656093 RepID=A0ABT8RV07_9FLAO|nr:hypothetical protein [Maribacter confluentis]MDO1514713.1 hypothetical protein [Maribacter confluentis]
MNEGAVQTFKGNKFYLMDYMGLETIPFKIDNLKNYYNPTNVRYIT